MSFSKKPNFKNSLILLILSIFIPMLLIYAYISYETYQIRYKAALQQNLEVARFAGQAFEKFVSGVVSTESIIEHTLEYSPNLSRDSINAILRESNDEYMNIKDFALLDPKGTVTACSAAGSIGRDLSVDSGVAAIIKGRDWAIGDLRPGVIADEPVFTISKALRSKEGVLTGIVSAIIDEGHLDHVFWLNRPKGAAISIMDSNGTLVYRHPRIEADFKHRNWLKVFPHIQASLSGKEESGTVFAPYEGKLRLYANCPLSFGWVAGAGITQDEVTAPIYKVIFYRAILFFLVMAAVFVLSLMLAGNFSKSIGRLRGLAGRIGEGQSHFDGEPFAILEFQELADAFGNMAGQIRSRQEQLYQLNEQLERRVAERTGELEQSNLRLRSANDELYYRTAKLRALASELTTVEQSVRKDVARILHDHLQQVLVALKFKIEAFAETGGFDPEKASIEFTGLVDEAIQITRSVTAQLRPPVMFQAGLPAGLEWLAGWMKRKHDFEVHLKIEDRLPDIGDDVKIFLFEASRELLFNAVKHSGAKSAMVTLRKKDGDFITVSVSDQGCGLDPEALKPSADKGSSLGLFSIMERIQFFGGTLEIDSGPGRGATFSVTIPSGQSQQQSAVHPN